MYGLLLYLLHFCRRKTLYLLLPCINAFLHICLRIFTVSELTLTASRAKCVEGILTNANEKFKQVISPEMFSSQGMNALFYYQWLFSCVIAYPILYCVYETEVPSETRGQEGIFKSV